MNRRAFLKLSITLVAALLFPHKVLSNNEHKVYLPNVLNGSNKIDIYTSAYDGLTFPLTFPI